MNEVLVRNTIPCYKDKDGTVIFSQNDLPTCAKDVERLSVYRLCLNGVIDSDAFECTYVSKQKNNLTIRDEELSNPTTFSTSCFSLLKDIKKKQALFTKNHPSVVVAVGDILEGFGRSCFDKELKPKTKSSHINWWIYSEAEPHNCFKEFNDEER